jgi:hypothetical protein
MFLYDNFNCKITFAMLIGTWRTTQENSTTTRTKRALVLADELGTLAWGDLT